MYSVASGAAHTHGMPHSSTVSCGCAFPSGLVDTNGKAHSTQAQTVGANQTNQTVGANQTNQTNQRGNTHKQPKPVRTKQTNQTNQRRRQNDNDASAGSSARALWFIWKDEEVGEDEVVEGDGEGGPPPDKDKQTESDEDKG